MCLSLSLLSFVYLHIQNISAIISSNISILPFLLFPSGTPNMPALDHLVLSPRPPRCIPVARRVSPCCFLWIIFIIISSISLILLPLECLCFLKFLKFYFLSFTYIFTMFMYFVKYLNVVKIAFQCLCNFIVSIMCCLFLLKMFNLGYGSHFPAS